MQETKESVQKPTSLKRRINIQLLIFLVSFYIGPIVLLFLPFYLVYTYGNQSDVFYYLTYSSLALELLLVLIFSRGYFMLPARLAHLSREKRVPELIRLALTQNIFNTWIIFSGFWLRRYAIAYLNDIYCQESVGALLLLKQEGTKRLSKFANLSLEELLEKNNLLTIEELENRLKENKIPKYEAVQVNNFMKLAQE